VTDDIYKELRQLVESLARFDKRLEDLEAKFEAISEVERIYARATMPVAIRRRATRHLHTVDDK